MFTKKVDFAKEKEKVTDLVKNLFNNFEEYISKHNESECWQLYSMESLDGTLMLKTKDINGDIYINVDETTLLIRIYYVLNICIADNFELICRLNNQLRLHKTRANIYVNHENKVVIERFWDLSGLLFNHSHENEDKLSKEESADIIKRIECFLKDKCTYTMIRIIEDYIKADKFDEACKVLEKSILNL